MKDNVNDNMKKSIIIIVFFLSIFNLFSQNVAEQKFRLAESYEKSGDLINSARIYEELTKEFPQNDTYFSGLARTLKMMNKYSELLPYAEDRYKSKPDIATSVLYAELLWRLGTTSEANNIWKIAIRTFKNVDIYAQISNSQVQLRLYEKAIEVLKAGREELKNPNLFYDELGKLYIAVGDYKNGTYEILQMLKTTSNLALAQGRLYALIVDKKAEDYIQKELKDFASGNSENITAQELYAWFLRTINRLDQALDVYKNIDRIKKANGAEILRFADDSRRDLQYDIALKAFATVIDLGKNNPYVNSALFGYARTLEQKMQSNKAISRSDAEEIIKRYRGIIKDYPATQQATESRVRIADLAIAYLQDEQMAIDELNTAIKEQPYSSVGANASLDLANIYINSENFDKAQPILNDLTTRFKNNLPAQSNQARFLTAEILFFKGMIDSSLTLFSELSIVPETDIANKSLSRIVLIEQNTQYVKALADYAKYELYARAKKYPQAIEKLKETASIAEGTNLGDIALKNKAEIEYKLQNYEASLATLNSLMKANPETIYGDFALMMTGDNNIALGRTEEAMKNYTDLLAQYPRSIYLNDVREKIKSLRQ